MERVEVLKVALYLAVELTWAPRVSLVVCQENRLISVHRTSSRVF